MSCQKEENIQVRIKSCNKKTPGTVGHLKDFVEMGLLCSTLENPSASTKPSSPARLSS